MLSALPISKTVLAFTPVLLQLDSDLLTNPIDTLKDGVTDALTGFIETTLGGAIDRIAGVVEFLMHMWVVPVRPPGADKYIQLGPGKGETGMLSDSIWTVFINLNESLTVLSISLLMLILIVYFTAGVAGFVDGDIGTVGFKMVFGLALLVVNKELLNVLYGFVNSLSWAIINSANFLGTGGGGLEETVGVFTNVFVGSLIYFGTPPGWILGGIVISLMMYYLLRLISIHVVGMLGYAFFPLLFVTYFLGEVFGVAEQKHQQLVGYFIPAMYAPVFYSLVFYVASGVLTTAFGYTAGKSPGYSGASENVRGGDAGILESGYDIALGAGSSIIEGFIGPLLFIFFMAIGFHIVNKQMKAGSTIAAGIRKTAGAAIMVAGAVATGGSSAAVAGAGKGLMYGGGVKGAIGGGVSGAVKNDEMPGTGDISSGFKNSQLGNAINSKSSLSSKAKKAIPGLSQSPEELTDEIHDEEQGPHDEDVDRVDDEWITDDEQDADEIDDVIGNEEADTGEWNDEFNDVKDGIVSDGVGMSGTKGKAASIVHGIGDQNGWGEEKRDSVMSDVMDSFDQKRGRLASLNKAGEIDMTDEEMNALALEETIEEEDELSNADLNTLAATRLEDGDVKPKKAIPNDPYNDSILQSLGNISDRARHQYLRRQFRAGFTEPHHENPHADTVTITAATDEDTVKAQRMGASITARETGTPGADLHAKGINEDGEVVFMTHGKEGLQPFTNTDELESLEFDEGTGEYRASIDDFDQAMTSSDIEGHDIAADRSVSIALEETNYDRMKQDEEGMKEAIDAATPDGITGEVITATTPEEVNEARAEAAIDAYRQANGSNKSIPAETHVGGFNSDFEVDAVITSNDEISTETDQANLQGELLEASGHAQGDYKMRFEDGTETTVELNGKPSDFDLDSVSGINGQEVRLKNAEITPSQSMMPGSGSKVEIHPETDVEVGTSAELTDVDVELMNDVSMVGESRMKNIKQQLHESDVTPEMGGGGDVHDVVENISVALEYNEKQDVVNTISQQEGVGAATAEKVVNKVETRVRNTMPSSSTSTSSGGSSGGSTSSSSGTVNKGVTATKSVQKNRTVEAADAARLRSEIEDAYDLSKYDHSDEKFTVQQAEYVEENTFTPEDNHGNPKRDDDGNVVEHQIGYLKSSTPAGDIKVPQVTINAQKSSKDTLENGKKYRIENASLRGFGEEKNNPRGKKTRSTYHEESEGVYEQLSIDEDTDVEEI